MSSVSPVLSIDIFRAAYQSSPDVLIIVDEQGRIVYTNDRCLDMLGYDPAELIGQSVEVLVPERYGSHEQMRRIYQIAPSARAMGRRPLLTARHKSGIEIPVDISLAPIAPAPGGTANLVLASMRNAMPRWLAEQEMQLQSVALDAAANGVVITDREGVIHWANPAVTRMTGYTNEELIGSHTRLLKSGKHGPDFYRELWETVLSGKTWFGEIANRRKDGSIYYEEQHIAPVRNDKGEITYYIAIKQDVTARKLAETALQAAHDELRRQLVEIESLQQQLRDQAVRDPLTMLFNRRYLDETLIREVARTRRDGTYLSVVLIDVDHFKNINDTAGHAAGDAVLKDLASLLSTAIRESDVACRVGGDEFLVLLPGASLSSAHKRAEEWLCSFSNAQQVTPTTLSIGVAQLRHPEESTDFLLRRCDEALYQAKRQGRNRVVSIS